MVIDLKRIGSKARELKPLNLRRLRKRRKDKSSRDRKSGLRKRLKLEDLKKDL